MGGVEDVVGGAFLPGVDGGGAAVLGGVVFEGVGMLCGVEHVVEPGEWVCFDVVVRV